MKRLFFVASLAIMAVACQKDEVKNEVLTPIGFNTELGKQTRAIQESGEGKYADNFGVFSYLYNAGATAGQAVMNNQKVTSAGTTVDATSGTEVKYYWPNDSDNHLDFYAYSPFTTNDKVGMTTEGTLTYTLDNSVNYWGAKAVDFMVATPVRGAKYSVKANDGVVPVEFHHELTQVKFVVEMLNTNADVEYTLVSIKMNGVTTSASYEKDLKDGYAAGKWTETASKTAVTAYPLDTEKDKGVGTKSTQPMLMIPKTPTTFDIEYTVKSNGVTETVKHNKVLDETVAKWVANKSITYTLKVAGPQIISFKPTVVDWDTTVQPDEIEIL